MITEGDLVKDNYEFWPKIKITFMDSSSNSIRRRTMKLHIGTVNMYCNNIHIASKTYAAFRPMK